MLRLLEGRAFLACALLAVFGAAPAAFAAERVASLDDEMLIRFQRVFAPEEIPPAYRAPISTPEKCATSLVREFEERRETISPVLAARLESYLAPSRSAGPFTHETDHFRFTYDTVGPDAVADIDASPANGIPDWIESVAAWAETAWTAHVDARGFPAPVAGTTKVDVSFREMGAYGYTERSSGVPRLVLHRDFEGFPANSDPEGSARGAAKVTCAHELMHACQLAASGWTEPSSWLEADAVYSEDVVFDEVDDYLHYLGGASPVGDPAAWAWNGPGYEDCLWFRALAEAHGDGIVRDFYARRNTHRMESVTRSFDETLRARGSSLGLAAARLARWSWLCGANAGGSAEGFEEAALYPMPSPFTHLGSVPSSADAPAAGLGTRYVLASAPTLLGRPQLFVAGNASRAYAVQVFALDRQGRRVVQSVAIASGRSELAEIPFEWSELVLLTIAVTVLDDVSTFASAVIELDDDLAVGVLDPSASARLELAPNRPNPFAGATTIVFELPRADIAHVAIYDLAGRLVKTLAHGAALEAGRHDATWAGVDEHGARVAPGVYAVRLTSGGATTSRKIHLLR